MRVAIDGIPLSRELTGVGHYTFELGLHLAAEYKEDRFSLLSPRAFVPAVNSVSPPSNLKLSRPTINPVIRYWWKRGLRSHLRREKFDLFHGTNFELPEGVDCATVLSIHDLSPLLHPDTHESHNVSRIRATLPRAARAATMIFSLTEVVREEIVEHLAVPREKVVAIPLAARSCFNRATAEEISQTRQKFALAEEFLLYVGTIEPRKNLLSLVRTFEQTLAQFPNQQLVVAGRKGWKVDELLAYVKQSPASNRIIFTGYVNDDELRALYSSCRLFIYPSIYEGFGLPPLEAMSCGAPVIASAIPSIAEVVGTAARLVKPDDYDELKKTIEELLSDSVARERLAVIGRKRASEFSWSKTAKATRAVYEEALQRYSKQKRASLSGD